MLNIQLMLHYFSSLFLESIFQNEPSSIISTLGPLMNLLNKFLLLNFLKAYLSPDTINRKFIYHLVINQVELVIFNIYKSILPKKKYCENYPKRSSVIMMINKYVYILIKNLVCRYPSVNSFHLMQIKNAYILSHINYFESILFFNYGQ